MYLRAFTVLFFLILSSFFICQKIEAKRSPPEKVEPVIYEGVKYSTGKMGYIEAWDVEKEEMLWEKEVYTVEYNPDLESDVQDVFITSLNIEDGKLVVVNEKGDVYKVDLSSPEDGAKDGKSETSSEEVTSENSEKPGEDLSTEGQEEWYKNKVTVIILVIFVITIPVDILVLYLLRKKSQT